MSQFILKFSVTKNNGLIHLMLVLDHVMEYYSIYWVKETFELFISRLLTSQLAIAMKIKICLPLCIV